MNHRITAMSGVHGVAKAEMTCAEIELDMIAVDVDVLSKSKQMPVYEG